MIDRTLRAALFTSFAVATVGAGAGCLFNRETAQPLTADQFVSQRVQGRSDPEPIDRPGQVIVDGVRPPAEADGDDAATGVAAAPPSADPSEAISPAVRQSTARTPGEAADDGETSPTTREVVVRTDLPATSPATTRGTGGGRYVVYGAVLAQVNSKPIYAHRVLALLDNALRTEARQQPTVYDFRGRAADLIFKEITNQINEELVYAVAEKSLDQKEKLVAEYLTAKWKNDEITKAGGSEELARRRWADEGWNFDERLNYQNRLFVTQLYLQRRIYPLVQVTASDIRRYYEKNKDTQFTSVPRARWRVIKIDPRGLNLEGGPAEARRLAEEIRTKAQAGESFEQLARALNDATLQASGGLVPGNKDGWLERGVYVAEKVETAAWALEPGQVTEVIEERGAFYVAKLEERDDADARPFEDLAVQQKIKELLESQQLRQLQAQRQALLTRDAVIWQSPQMMQVAVDMAMQRYPKWRAAK